MDNWMNKGKRLLSSNRARPTMRHFAAITGLLLSCLLLPSSAVAGPDDGHFNPPKQYYVALGDSEAFGFQLAKFEQEIASNSYDPNSFDTGYVDDFAVMLHTIRPSLQVVNFSCPGETTASLIGGNCPFHSASRPLALHNNYPITTPQLTAAVNFLRSHPGIVSPITIDIGGNDVQDLFFNTCHQNIACTEAKLPGVLAQVQTNLDRILVALASESPSSEIILLTVGNPFVVAVGEPSTQVVQALNATLTVVARSHGVRVADGYTPFSTPADICALTFMCSQGDIHPTDAGYAVLAKAVWAASGFDRLTPAITTTNT
jgi:lysophospholipase L1-like esterase